MTRRRMIGLLGGCVAFGAGLGVVDYLQREPEAVVRVNEAAEVLADGAGPRLEARVDEILAAYLPVAQTLPEADLVPGRVVPSVEVPAEFRALGGDFGEPEVLLRSGDEATPPAVVLSWAHMRHGIIIYAAVPSDAPQGFFTRKVGDRTFVVAGKS